MHTCPRHMDGWTDGRMNITATVPRFILTNALHAKKTFQSQQNKLSPDLVHFYLRPGNRLGPIITALQPAWGSALHK